MKSFFTFLTVGSFFSTVEEFLTIVVLKRDVASYVFTLVILFPVFLTFVYHSSRLLGRGPLMRPTQQVAYFLIYGGLGLLAEWFLMGLAPWSNPAANPALMFVFQLGMFSFWATVAFAPLLFITPGEVAKKTRRAVLTFYLPYFLIVYVASLSVPETARFVTVISLVLFGYLFLNLFYVRYFRQAFAQFSRESRGAGI